MINQPFNTTVHKNKIYVADQGGSIIEIYDLNEKKFSFFSPQGRGQTKGPINVAFDENDYMYIADAKRKEVLIFNEKLVYVNSIRDTGITRPVDVKIYDNKVYIADIKAQAVKVYSTEKGNKLLYTFVDNSSGEDELVRHPTSIAINKEHVYVLDGMLARVQKYTHDGKYVGTVGGHGTNIGLFGRPKSITLDREGNLVVVDGAWVNTQIFNKEDKLLMWFGSKSTDPGGLYGPMGITVDYDNLDFFQPFVDPGYQLKYLVFICNQFGHNKINVYGAVDPININETAEPDIKDDTEPEEKEE
jgi:DNA-binding beta-propeller fold protein YncE